MKKVILSLVLLVSAMQVGCGSNKSPSEINATQSPVAACTANFAAQGTSAFLSDIPVGSCCIMVYDPDSYVYGNCEYIVSANGPQSEYAGSYPFNVTTAVLPFSLMGELSNVASAALNACQAAGSGIGCQAGYGNSLASKDQCPSQGC